MKTSAINEQVLRAYGLSLGVALLSVGCGGAPTAARRRTERANPRRSDVSFHRQSRSVPPESTARTASEERRRASPIRSVVKAGS